MLLIVVATISVVWLAVTVVMISACAMAARGDRALAGSRSRAQAEPGAARRPRRLRRCYCAGRGGPYAGAT